MLHQPRLFPIDICDLVILPYNVKTQAHLTKIDLVSFLEI